MVRASNDNLTEEQLVSFAKIFMLSSRTNHGEGKRKRNDDKRLLTRFVFEDCFV